MAGDSIVKETQQASGRGANRLVEFVRDLIRIPSPSGNEARVAERVAAEMNALGYPEVVQDRLGSVLGRVGTGPIKIFYDAHMDTVDAMEPASWAHPPYTAEVENGIIYGLGAVDDKGCLGGLIHAGGALASLGYDRHFTLYVAGIVGEENCEGYAAEKLFKEFGIAPDYALIGESSRLEVKRGHKGRATIIVSVPGKAAHASAPELADNPLYKAAAFIQAVSNMGPACAYHDFLGRGTVAATRVDVVSASINTVPEMCKVYLDRRLVAGEDLARVMSEIISLAPAGSVVELMRYSGPAYTGAMIEADEYFPPWFLPEDHVLVRAGVRAAGMLGLAARAGQWAFSTDAAYTMGVAGIPTIGFGPGEPDHCHSKNDQVRIEDLVKAQEFYTLLPLAIAGLLSD